MIHHNVYNMVYICALLSQGPHVDNVLLQLNCSIKIYHNNNFLSLVFYTLFYTFK